MTGHPLIDLERVSKTFPGVKALDDVSLRVDEGEIVAILGHNGSGKSTLVKILAGVHRADPGTGLGAARGHGERMAGAAPDAELHFIHQELGLVGSLSAIENLDLSRRLDRRGLLPSHTHAERRHAEEVIAAFGTSFDVRVPVEELSPAERAIIAIARALDGWTHNRNVLLLDEPTAALHGEEVSKLFTAVRHVAERGAGVIFITHRLDEALDLAHRIVVLRDGRVIADLPREEADHDQLVRLIAGTELTDAIGAPRETGEPILGVIGLSGSRIQSLDLELRESEVVGISGVLGSGREEVAPILFGALPGAAVEVRVDGRAMAALTPKAAIRAGIAYLPGDRHRAGAVMSMSARENITLVELSPFRRRFARLDGRAERSEASRLMDAFGVRSADPEQPLELLSGGNQQKVVLAKWLRLEPRVLLLDEPTQGVDVGGKAGVHEQISAAAASGTAVLISSSDTKELALLCDRVLVMRGGAVVAEVNRREMSEDRLVREGLGLPSQNGARPDTGDGS